MKLVVLKRTLAGNKKQGDRWAPSQFYKKGGKGPTRFKFSVGIAKDSEDPKKLHEISPTSCKGEPCSFLDHNNLHELPFMNITL